MSAKNLTEILDLGDDEFEKTMGPPEDEKPSEKKAEEEVQPLPDEKPVEDQPETPKTPEPAPTQEDVEQEEKEEEDPESDEELEKPVEKAKPEEGKDAFAGESTKVPEEKKEPAEEKPAVEEKKPDASKAGVDSAQFEQYKSFHDRVMAPIKANGSVIQLQSVEEVVQLIQMGANYTKKLQQLQPQKKLLMMLENNGLLNEEKLNFLIDLDKKDPEAIKKLLKDAKIDPIDLDTSKVNYRSGSHGVTDQEAALTTAIQDLNDLEGGRETLQSINATWDQPSKQFLWQNPDVLKVIHAQRQSGIYAKIAAEIDRRKTLGHLSPTMNFVQAYKTVGDDLTARGAFQTQPKPDPAPKSGTGAPVAVRPGKAPVSAATDKRVQAAAPTRTTAKTAQVSTNYLAMSDEEFEKQRPPS